MTNDTQGEEGRTVKDKAQEEQAIFNRGVWAGRAMVVREAIKIIEDANGGMATPLSEKLRAQAERIERGEG